MAGLCKIAIIGNLGRDPEMRFTQTGRPLTRFSVAVNRYSTGPDGERKEQTEWFDVKAWGRLAETASEILSKGKRVYVEGRFETRPWEGQDGQRRVALEITAAEIVLLDPRQSRPMDDDSSPRVDDLEADDIPF